MPTSKDHDLIIIILDANTEMSPKLLGMKSLLIIDGGGLWTQPFYLDIIRKCVPERLVEESRL